MLGGETPPSFFEVEEMLYTERGEIKNVEQQSNFIRKFSKRC